MKNNLEEDLYKEFPRLFINRDESCMKYGINHSDGWNSIVRNMCIELDSIISKMPYNEIDQYYITQIKEKFGILRVYMSKYTPEINNVIGKFVEESGNTCEYTGLPGVRDSISHGWIKTLNPTFGKKAAEMQREIWELKYEVKTLKRKLKDKE